MKFKKKSILTRTTFNIVNKMFVVSRLLCHFSENCIAI